MRISIPGLGSYEVDDTGAAPKAVVVDPAPIADTEVLPAPAQLPIIDNSAEAAPAEAPAETPAAQ